jgi:dTDP-4-amino-4,6-dideoxygalactose transaminase
MAGSLAPWVSFCRDRGKVLLCDAAVAFDGAHRVPGADSPPEIVSFHHTKPWGMGEGGCAMVPRAHEDVFRSLINFGIFRRQATGARSTNAKLSDFAAAFILQRLRDFPCIADRYRAQYARIADVGRRSGFTVLDAAPHVGTARATPASVPLLAPRPIPLEALGNETVTLRKYYAPLAADCPVAADLYARIVNVPCHPGMEGLETAQISAALDALLARAGTPPGSLHPPAPRRPGALAWNLFARLRGWMRGAA